MYINNTCVSLTYMCTLIIIFYYHPHIWPSRPGRQYVFSTVDVLQCCTRVTSVCQTLSRHERTRRKHTRATKGGGDESNRWIQLTSDKFHANATDSFDTGASRLSGLSKPRKTINAFAFALMCINHFREIYLNIFDTHTFSIHIAK